MQTKDRFLREWLKLRKHADIASYAATTCPEDAVQYPGICQDIPAYIRDEVVQKLAIHHQSFVAIRSLFLRQSMERVVTPHGAHTDTRMGSYLLVVYMNRTQHCQGGTSLVRHKETGMATDPVDQAGWDTWLRDTKVRDAWEITDMSLMVPNRAVIIDTKQMHRAEPVEGFGSSNKDCRLALTAFYDLVSW